MLHYAIGLMVIASIAAVLGFTGIAGASAGIAKILFKRQAGRFLSSHPPRQGQRRGRRSMRASCKTRPCGIKDRAMRHGRFETIKHLPRKYTGT